MEKDSEVIEGVPKIFLTIEKEDGEERGESQIFNDQKRENAGNIISVALY